MGDLEKSLLEAVPADARRLLIVGKDVLAHRALWEMRNPLATIDSPTGPWTRPLQQEKGTKADAALLSLDALGDDAAAAAMRVVNGLAPTATLALFAASPGADAALATLAAQLQERGLRVERRIDAGAAHRLWRFQSAAAEMPPIRVQGDPFKLGERPIDQSMVRVRLREPFEQLNSLPGIRCEVGQEGELPAIPDAEGAKILLIQRKFFDEPEAVLGMIRSNGFLTILELDDMFLESERIPFALYKKNLASFHALQTSTPFLAKFLRQFHPEVGIVNNHLARIRPLQPRPPASTVRIVFAGLNRHAGWGEIVDAYREVVLRHGERVRTVVVGDREFPQKLLPAKSISMPTLAYSDYVAELEKADIALLPLADNDFDRAKTDLKFLECAEAGAVVLASHVVYGETVKAGKTGFLYRNADEFKRHLESLIVESANRAKMARQAHRYVSEHRALANHVRHQYEWYRSLVERRDALEQARRERVGQP